MIPKNYDKLKQMVKATVEKSFTVGEAIVNLHKLYYPDIDEIEKFNGYHEVSKELVLYIYDLFKERFGDRAMLMWMNWGFSHDDKLTGAEYRLAKVTYKRKDAIAA